jgi:hypothetical protein
VVYASSSSALATGSALTFDGTNLGIGTSSPLSKLDVAVEATLTRRFLVNFDDSVITIKGASNTAAPEGLRIIGDGIRFNTGTTGSGTEIGRFTSTGLGIGTSSPEQKLDVVGAVNLRNSGRRGTFEIDSSGNLWMGTGTTAGNIYFETGHSGGDLPSTGTERVKINQYGIGLGLATPSSGAGITFPATQSASSNAKTLDDYEEGTWTPIDGSAATLTFTANTGFYTKIGNLVTAQGVFTYPVTTTGNAARVGGLPFGQTNVTTAGGFVTSSGGANTLMIQSPYAGAVQFYKVGDVTEVNSALSGQTVAITLIYRTT